MSIKDQISQEQIERIVDIIRRQCDDAARHDNQNRIRIGEDLYKLLKKGRKAHDITGDVYAGFFYPENHIEGLDIRVIENGNYNQQELRTEAAVIHIYHESNQSYY